MVVLPDPFAPMRPSFWPELISKEAPVRTGWGAVVCCYVLKAGYPHVGNSCLSGSFPSRTANAGESKRGATAGRSSGVALFDQPSREPGWEHLFVFAGRTFTRRGYSAGYAHHPDQASYVPDFYQESPNGKGQVGIVTQASRVAGCQTASVHRTRLPSAGGHVGPPLRPGGGGGGT